MSTPEAVATADEYNVAAYIRAANPGYKAASILANHRRCAVEDATAVLRKALAPLAEVARINDLYSGPPCNNSPHPDSKTVLYYQHGDDEVRITLGDCRKARELLSS